MQHVPTASEVMDRELPAIRSKLLHLAAALDRIDRAGGSVADEDRLEKVRQSLAVLSDGTADRAGQVQMIFSFPYDADWQRTET